MANGRRNRKIYGRRRQNERRKLSKQPQLSTLQNPKGGKRKCEKE